MNKKYIYLIFAVLISVVLLTGCEPAVGGIVRVATDATWPPFESIDTESKEIVGLDIDLMSAIAEKAGFEVQFINVAFDTLLTGMAQCQYDVAISSITITADRAADFSFSNPYFAAGQIVVVRADNTGIANHLDLVGKEVGVQLDTTGDIEAAKIEGAILHRYDDIELAFQDLINLQLDAVIADNPLALSVVGKNPGQLKTVGEIFTDENYGIAVCKTNVNLVKEINIALAELRADGYIDDLTQTWIVGSNP